MERQFNTNRRVKSESGQPSQSGPIQGLQDLTKLTLTIDNNPQTYLSAKIDGCAVRFAFMPPEFVEISIHAGPKNTLNVETDAKVVDAVQAYIRTNQLYLGFGIPPSFEGVGFITRITSEGEKKET